MRITPAKMKLSKKVILYTLIVVAVGLSIVAYALPKPAQTPVDSRTTTKGEDKKLNSQAKSDAARDKQNFLDNEAQQAEKTNEDQAPIAPIVTLSAKTNGDAVVVTTNLGTIASGICTLTITGGAQPVIKTAQAMYTPEYSSCAGFSLPISEVNAKTWSIELSVTSPAGTYTKSITYTPQQQ